MLEKSNRIPLYFQLKRIFLDRIRKKIYEIGEIIPSEIEIQKKFNVSRITVRRAIMELENEGYLARKPGKGTFVTKYNIDKVIQRLDNISSWTETLEERGIKPGTIKKKIVQIIPPRKVAVALKLGQNEKLTKIKRWRTGNNKPFCIMTNYILSHFIPNIDKINWGSESLYKVYEEKYNIKFGIAKEIVEARPATKEESNFFEISPKYPVLAITRITCDSNGNPFEVVKSANCADFYKYVVSLKGRPKHQK